MSGFFGKLFSSPKRQSTRKRKRSPSLQQSSQQSSQPLMIHSPLRLLLNTQMPDMRMPIMPVMHNRPTLKRTGNYHSEQTHIEYVNGKQKERRQIVDINGKNGTKTVIGKNRNLQNHCLQRKLNAFANVNLCLGFLRAVTSVYDNKCII